MRKEGVSKMKYFEYKIISIRYEYSCSLSSNRIGWDDYIIGAEKAKFSLKEMISQKHSSYTIEFASMNQLPIYYLYTTVGNNEVKISYILGSINYKQTIENPRLNEIGDILLTFQDVARLKNKIIKMNVYDYSH